MKQNTSGTDFRARIYSEYQVLWPRQKTFFDEQEALRWGRYYRHVLRRLLPDAKDAEILDVGCGTAMLLFNLKHMGYTNLHGVDMSPEQVRIARQAVGQVFQGDVLEYLSNEKERFHLILAMDFIEHLTKCEVFTFLDACYQALLPQGRLIVQTVNAHSPMGLSCRYTDLSHEICFSPGCLRNVLALAGFKEYKAREKSPAPLGFVSGVRFLLWQVIRLHLWMYDMIELGGPSYKVYTRDFIATAVKK